MQRSPFRWRRSLLAALLLAGSLAACGPDRPALTPEQTAAIETVTRVLSWAGGVQAAFSKIADLERYLPSLIFQPFGDCPRLSPRRQGLGLALQFDYAGGCRSPLAFGQTVNGALRLGFDLREFEGTVGFESFQLGRHGVTGAIGLRPIDRRLGRLRLRFDDLRIDQIGTLTGQSALAINLDGDLAMQDGELQIRDVLATDYSVKLAELGINPLRNGNCVPQSGTVTFVVPVKVLGLHAVEMKVGFLPTTPRDGIVKVYAGPFGPFDYTLRHVVDEVRSRVSER